MAVSPLKHPTRRAGLGRLGSRFIQLYEALEPRDCHVCARVIALGELFSRGGVPGQSTGVPVCRECRPVVRWSGERPLGDQLWSRR